MKTAHCPALVIAAPSSGQGKTSITAALAHYHCQQGKNVIVFKVGPDFLDPMLLEQASKNPVEQLDLWMVGEDACREQLFRAAQTADLILIEGVMGLFDGTPCTADIAKKFGVPVVLLINARAMGQTFAAIASGLVNFDPHLNIQGVLANNVGSQHHEVMLRQNLSADINWLGRIPRDKKVQLPNRHLGLKQASELHDLDQRLDQLAGYIANTHLSELPAPTAFINSTEDQPPPLLSGKIIAIAKDEAFSFIYADNIRFLKEMGAHIVYFSPLFDKHLPAADAIWLPGGYPELHLSTLSANKTLNADIIAHANQGKAIYAECGGMLYLAKSITDTDLASCEMLGLIPAHAKMQPTLANLGMQYVSKERESLRGHTFHYSTFECDWPPSGHATRHRDNGIGEKIYNAGSIYASYMHAWFRSSPALSASLFSPE